MNPTLKDRILWALGRRHSVATIARVYQVDPRLVAALRQPRRQPAGPRHSVIERAASTAAVIGFSFFCAYVFAGCI